MDSEWYEIFDERCWECDSRYCRYTGDGRCQNVPGNLYVVYHGHVPLETALAFAANGYEVDVLTRPGYLSGHPRGRWDPETETVLPHPTLDRFTGWHGPLSPEDAAELVGDFLAALEAEKVEA